MLNLFATFNGLLFAEEAVAPGKAPGIFDLLWPMALIGILFYFLMIRPERRKRSQVGQMQETLKKNDRIVTIGGIVGVIVNASKGSEEVTIRIDENNNTRMHILRSSISRIVTGEKSGDDEKKDTDAE